MGRGKRGDKVQKGIRNAIMNSRNGYVTFGTNQPYTQDSEKQYYADMTKAYYEENLPYASNVVRAQVQGVNYNDFYTFTPLLLRTAMVIDPTTGNNLGSDWQRIIAVDGNINFLPRGAKVVFNGNTWLVCNPMNVESVNGTAVICRCNATWHYLDEYGNVKSEPFRYGQGAGELATTNDVKENMILMNGYQHCVMQLNDDTKVLSHNMRMILGNQAFTVRGLQNFVQEFTADDDSVHIQWFDLGVSEPLEIDDMEKRVAGGKTFKWELSLLGRENMSAEETQQLTAVSTQGGEKVTLTVDYLWESSNEEVLTVTADGLAVAVSEGEATVTCTLVQNPAISQTMTVNVFAQSAGNALAWLTAVPDKLVQYQTAVLQAGAVDTMVTYELTGADPACYEAKQDGNVLTVTCWQPSETPLTIMAIAMDESLTANILLEGW